MSLFKLDKTYFDTFKVLTKPVRSFASSSAGGAVGSVRVFPQTSLGMKDLKSDMTVEISGSEAPNADSLMAVYQAIGEEFNVSSSNPDFTSGFGLLENYMEKVNSASVSAKMQKQVEILRFEPSFKFTSDTLRKRVIESVLFPYYRVQYGSSCNWAFSNYHSLNFFTTDPTLEEQYSVPTGSVLIYPASSSNFIQSTYLPSGAFSFEFYINPRYSNFSPGGTYQAGTLFHMSSSYAVSLVSGSSVGPDGLTNGFRLLLQLSHSADIPPSSCSLGVVTPSGTNNHDLVFSSSDNSLLLNNWHHCCIRWGGTTTQNGTGSFVIDNIERGTFSIPSSSKIQQTQWYADNPAPNALFVGNFYEGQNNQDVGLDSGANEDYITQFFHPAVAYRDGIQNFYPGIDKDSLIPENQDPDDYRFNHPLQAEVHELKIYDKYRTDAEIITGSAYGVENILSESNLQFYVPPFFVKNTNQREIFQTPFQTAYGSTDDPFNVPLSFGVGGHYLNLENFTKEFVNGVWPRLFLLSGSTIDDSTGWLSCNNFLYGTGSVRKRNLTILPCDNGKLMPNFQILSQSVTSSAGMSLFVDDIGVRNLSLVSLKDLLPTGSIGEGILGSETPGSLSSELAGPTPDDPSIPAGQILTIYNRTKDPSSNEVSFFDASNLFYGKKIDPRSFTIQDESVTGSGGRVKITLTDNGAGSLYRSDCTGSHPEWASVGTLLYDEGIAVVKDPCLPRFGVDQFKVNLRGQQNIYVLQMSIPAYGGELGYSRNPTRVGNDNLRPSPTAADADNRFVYMTNVNLLDENLNVICKSNFSQPIIKRDDEKFVIRIRLDF
tara:strand:- start:11981 stop:14461 length:2481 start_codon:yes stop_codon:yes gene_type:complete